MLMELSMRVRRAIGDDSLDAFIKEILAEESRAMVLMPTAAEREKLAAVKENIFIEVFSNFVNMTLRNSADSAGDFKTFKFSGNYVEMLTERQKKLMAPALKMAGFIEQLRLDKFELLPDWTVRYVPARLADKFDDKEEEIKMSLKKMMEKHLVDTTE